ncbi:MAG: sugar transferase [Anaerolineae bacterium]|nr:sugar transferase [Anaerolineae bacterium]
MQSQGTLGILIERTEMRGGYLLLKRCLDVVVSLSVLILLAPLFLILAVLIMLDSPGSPIFAQERVASVRRRGRQGHLGEMKTFTFYKFRTMYQDSDSGVHRKFTEAYINGDEKTLGLLQKTNAARECQYKIANDPRITRIGRLLRKTSMDELPQFWNILKGDMSLVGPRPPIPYEVEMYDTMHLNRLAAKPGLTGLWQVVARSSVSFEEMVRLDIQYAESQSLWLDLKILCKTPQAVFSGKGAR